MEKEIRIPQALDNCIRRTEKFRTLASRAAEVGGIYTNCTSESHCVGICDVVSLPRMGSSPSLQTRIPCKESKEKTSQSNRQSLSYIDAGAESGISALLQSIGSL